MFPSRVLLVLVAVTGCLTEDIVPVRTGGGPTPRPGGSRRKDPTADLPDLSRDELLAILDLIEKSGDSKPGARTVPPQYPPTTAAPLYPAIPDDIRGPSAPTSMPSNGPAHTPTVAPYNRPTASPPTDFSPVAPPNYPAPIAPPMPASTTPKPKKSFFDKVIGGVLKIVAPQNPSDTAKASPGALLNGLLSQLQNAQQSNPGQGNPPPASSGNVLNNLLNRLQGQNSEGSQFVTNLIQTLQSNRGPSAAQGQPSGTPAHGQSAGEQLFSSLLKSLSQGQQGQNGQSSGSNFAEMLQRQIFNRNGDSSSSSDKKNPADLLFEGFRQVLQPTRTQ
ncbi:protein enabled homolog [Galendromus occidentalis]|uniref:Protein enabled homolog n=1 Tax=Galendromus occidentalis TaxID=34638 RepID=A0AAJ6VXG6_9ACAR|nr:protein enabled homolog [Galendromus occidentalis]